MVASQRMDEEHDSVHGDASVRRVKPSRPTQMSE